MNGNGSSVIPVPKGPWNGGMPGKSLVMHAFGAAGHSVTRFLNGTGSECMYFRRNNKNYRNEVTSIEKVSQALSGNAPTRDDAGIGPVLI